MHKQKKIQKQKYDISLKNKIVNTSRTIQNNYLFCNGENISHHGELYQEAGRQGDMVCSIQNNNKVDTYQDWCQSKNALCYLEGNQNNQENLCQNIPTAIFIQFFNTKHCKSSKRTIPSCKHLLNISKKRDTCSMVSLSNPKNLLTNSSRPPQQHKTKKKNKKNHTTSTLHKNINPPKITLNDQIHSRHQQWNNTLNDDQYYSSKNHHNDSENSLQMNYPLSMSHSYIVFSQKQSTLKHPQKHSKPSQPISNKNKLIYITDKLQQIKKQHAAIIIQKHWRGFMTRKLLQDYILNQEFQLVNQLNIFKNCQYQYQKINKKKLKIKSNNPHHLHLNHNFSQLSSINKKPITISKPHHQPILHHQSNSQTLTTNSQQQNQYIYRKQSPIINGLVIQNQIFQSIEQFQQSFTTTYRQNKNPNIISKNRQDNFISPPPQHLSHQLTTKYQLHQPQKLFTITHQINQTYNPHLPSQSHQDLNATILIQNQSKSAQPLSSKFQTFFHQFTEQLKTIINQDISICQQYLTDQVKNCFIPFKSVLQIRQQLRHLTLTLDQQIHTFHTQIQVIYHSLTTFYSISTPNTNTPRPLYLPSTHPPKTKPQKLKTSLIKTSCDLINDYPNPNQFKPTPHLSPSQQIYDFNYQHQNIQQQSQIIHGSPVSQYFTIQLPTQQLSPHKSPSNSGLQSLKTYLQNLQQQYLSQSSSCSQTSYLCNVLKKHSQIGPQNMIQRCLIQMLVQMLTGKFTIQNILFSITIIITDQYQQQNYNQHCIEFVKKWADQINKWELGTIQEVPGNMEESIDATQRNDIIRQNVHGELSQWLG